MSVQVLDSLRIADDPALSGGITTALDPTAMSRRFASPDFLPSRAGKAVTLQAIRVARHKRGRRCVIEYDVEIRGASERLTVIGKIRARHNPRRAHELAARLREAGFSERSEDGIGVPEPLGVFADLGMWLQRKVPGRAATELLLEPAATRLVEKIAEAAHKLHCARIPAKRTHTMVDELRVLRERLSEVAQKQPRWAARIGRLLVACERLGAELPPPVPCGIHRDFYPDQVMADESRLWLIDFDLYCVGDRGLDIGNFLGHITEYSLRTLGNADALAPLEHAMAERFALLAGSAATRAAATYATLTLARHVYLSTLLAERRPNTGRIVELCEERLAKRTANHVKTAHPL